MDHKAEFKLIVLENYEKELANAIEWSNPRLLCIAGDFTKYDEHAVQQINRNIELIRYKKYGDELLLLELVNATTAQPVSTPDKPKYKTVTDYMARQTHSLKIFMKRLKLFYWHSVMTFRRRRCNFISPSNASKTLPVSKSTPSLITFSCI